MLIKTRGESRSGDELSFKAAKNASYEFINCWYRCSEKSYFYERLKNRSL